MSPKKLDRLFSTFRLPFIERRRQRKRRERIRELTLSPPMEDPFPYPPRKRALTLPGTDYQEKQQSSCPFFNKLPLEVRRDIYEKVMGASILHVGILNRGLRHWVCQEDGKCNETRVHSCFYDGLDTSFARLPLPEAPKDRNLLPILLTCHQA